MTDQVTRYARQVVKGRVLVGALHRAACQRHLADLDNRRARGLVWAPAKAARVIAFFSHLRHFKGEWAGRSLELAPWQAFIVGSLFGWQRDGLRRFRTAFIELPRGNGKSTLAGGLGLWMAFFDGEPGAEAYAVATKQDQARICWDAARHMILRVPALRSRIAIQQHNLHQLSSASKFEPLGADSKTLDGLRPHFVVADEVHAHKNSDVIDVMLTGMGTRREPMLFEITTAGINRQGPWWAHREYTRLILDGRHEDDAWFGLIAGADEDDDWKAPAIWRKANPNYGVSVKTDYLEVECRKAAAMPIFQSAFRRLHVGQLVAQEEKVIDRQAWDRGADRTLTVDDFAGRPCYGGLDLSSTTDLTAFVLLFEDEGGGYVAFPQFWIPGDNIEKRVARDRVPYDAWARDGWVTVTPGNITDYDIVRRDLVALLGRRDLRVLAYDPSNATQLATQLANELGADKLLPIPQGFRWYNDPTRRLIALVEGGGLRHPGHPVLSWCADNLTVTNNSYGEIRPDKSLAIERIDGMVALIMALGRAITHPAPLVSKYETTDLYVL
jgi:phage terminase large subunit-like protein